MRIRPLNRDQAREDVRHYFDEDAERYGMPLNTTRVYAHSPELMRGARGLNIAVAKAGRIPDALRALLSVRVAAQVGCPF